jgi:MFS family permease
MAEIDPNFGQRSPCRMLTQADTTNGPRNATTMGSKLRAANARWRYNRLVCHKIMRRLLPGHGRKRVTTIPMATPTIRLPIPRTVWVLGFVSMFMDVSSEIVHALLPIFLTSTLGASVAFVGLLDGTAEATASIAKVYSGYLSDRVGKRKPLILLGYGLGAFSKPFFALAGSPALVLGARLVDRVGKGLRGAPRDALVADVTPIAIRGRAYGLRQSLDTVGAFVGPLIAIVLMAVLANDIRTVFWIAAIPGAVAVLLVAFGLDGGNHRSASRDVKLPLRMSDLRTFDRGFWSVVVTGIVFTMARFSEAFLILRATGMGLPVALAPLVLVLMNLVYSLGAYPAGALSDSTGPRMPMFIALVCLVAADGMLAAGTGLVAIFVGIGFWGLHMAFSQGLLAQLVADRCPENRRGSAFGLFNLATGLATLVSSVVAGILWDRVGAPAAFMTGGGFATLAALLLMIPNTTPTNES